MTFQDPHWKPPEHVLKSAAVLNCIGTEAHWLSDVAHATAFARTTVIRIVAILVEEGILHARLSGGDVELSMIPRNVQNRAIGASD